MKKFIAPALALLLIAATGSLAVAAPHDGRPGRGDGYRHGNYDRFDDMDIPKEKRDAYFNIRREYFEKSAPIMEELWAKRTELNALSPNPNVKPEAISKMVQEIRDLRGKLFSLHKEMNDKMEKEIGIRAGFGHGRMGCGGQGFHGGYGFHE